MGVLINNKVLEKDSNMKSQLIAKGYGSRDKTDFWLDCYEVLYLMEKKSYEVFDHKDKSIDFEKMLKILAKDKKEKTLAKYLVYKDFRERGYVIKTGFKFGFDFRVYPRGKKMGEGHTEWVVAVLEEKDMFNGTEISRQARMSLGLKTKLLVAMVDHENEINYYEINRITP